MGERIFNFSPGPAMLPMKVLKVVEANLLNYKDSGIGVMEMSHRSSAFEQIIKEAETLLRDLLNVGDDYVVLFIPGGGTLQFSMVPLNLTRPDTIPNYIVSGYWAEKAFGEAKRLGPAHVAASSKDINHRAIPTQINFSAQPASYLHSTSNNTIYGTQFQTEPDPGTTHLVCDASSDLLSRPIKIDKYGLIYSAAQKNLGPSGISVIIMKKELLQYSPKNLPIMLDYNTYAANNSLYNTPPTFPIYVMKEMFNWIKEQGGVAAIDKINRKKAAVLYDALDSMDFYEAVADKNSRSLMNVTFRLKVSDLEKKFFLEASTRGLSGLEGHRAVGGVRASIYNGFPYEGTVALAQFMRDFAKANG